MTGTTQEHTQISGHLGSVRSYVIGFLLSLVFTIVPYFMVRGQMAEEKALLLGVLGFAIIQMFVQIFFFLHLGRGPKPFYNVVFFLGTAGMIVLVVGASIIIMDNLYRNMSPQEMTTRLAQEENIAELSGKPTGACQGNGDNHSVVIEEGVVSPNHIDANRCDTLTLVNRDDANHEFAFGTHEDLMSYGGIYEVPVKSGRSKSITLNEIGSFNFHDHANPAVAGSFTVSP